jgi:hypothetical protein
MNQVSSTFKDSDGIDAHYPDESSRTEQKNKTKSASKLEDPKDAFGRDRARAFKHFLLFHAVPLTGACALVVLNFQGWYWGTEVSFLSLLQFVAKLHEILMQASMGMVSTQVMHIQIPALI